MNASRPNNLIIHNDQQRTLIPWHWLFRVYANRSASTVMLVFSGLKIQVTTIKVFELIDAIENGDVHRIRVAPVKEPEANDFVVDSVIMHDEDDQ